MNKLPRQKRVEIISQLVEGMSLRAITRTTGVSINTVTNLLVTAGKACDDYQDRTLRNLTCNYIQVDEIWAFCYAKAKNVATAKAAPEDAGDVWTWVAIDRDTKLVPSWHVGGRGAAEAYELMSDLNSRVTNKMQITTDGHRAYMEAVPRVFGEDVDYSVLIKHYASPRPEPEAARRYSPTECIGAEKRAIIGSPSRSKTSTSHVERQNLTMRMSMRRFTRLTNAFSKKVENHMHAVALHFMHYNFCRIHMSLRMTPAMRAGVTEKLWDVVDIVRVIEDWEREQGKVAA